MFLKTEIDGVFDIRVGSLKTKIKLSQPGINYTMDCSHLIFGYGSWWLILVFQILNQSVYEKHTYVTDRI